MIPRILSCLIFTLNLSAIHAEEGAPKVFAGLLTKDEPIQAQIGMVIPPTEIDKYVAKVAAAARKNQEWFSNYSKDSAPGIPLPYHENLGLTQEEYNEYIKLWNQREFKAIGDIILLLRESSDESWIITATGRASSLSTLRYHPATDTFRSPNGKMERLEEDIDAPADSILGAWKGREWRFLEETGLGSTKENIALGHSSDGKFGMIVYRVQELTQTGSRLLDKSMMIRFPIQTKTQ